MLRRVDFGDYCSFVEKERTELLVRALSLYTIHLAETQNIQCARNSFLLAMLMVLVECK